ncbi:MAG: hypothetical protein JWN64_714 [Parcubacteria group bacterium]|nr:hypothetical protein [Parcubacteria group bacterium]
MRSSGERFSYFLERFLDLVQRPLARISEAQEVELRHHDQIADGLDVVFLENAERSLGQRAQNTNGLGPGIAWRNRIAHGVPPEAILT